MWRAWCRRARTSPLADAALATRGSAGAITGTTIKNHLLGTRPDRGINDWTHNHPEIAGYMTRLVVE